MEKKFKNWKIGLFMLFFVWMNNSSFAHEPIYGLGPETLPKYMHAIELGRSFQSGSAMYDLGYGFGITQNWTVRLDAPLVYNSNRLSMGDMRFRTKYALWRQTEPGVLKRLTAIIAMSIPTASDNFGENSNATRVTLGIANGYESRRWYYFSDLAYTVKTGGRNEPSVGKLSYNLVGGIRPVKTGYLKPDLVLLVELNGEQIGKSKINNSEIAGTGGNTLAIAPGFLLSYRNIMLKGGVQFNVAHTKYIDQPAINGLVSLEYHF